MAYSKIQRISQLEGKIRALVKRIANTSDSRIAAAELEEARRELAALKQAH